MTTAVKTEADASTLATAPVPAPAQAPVPVTTPKIEQEKKPMVEEPAASEG